MAVDVPGTGEEERLIWRFGIVKGGKKRIDKMGKREETAWPRCILLSLSGSRLCGCIDF